MRIAFVHYPGRIARLDSARSGKGPSEFLFGAVELEKLGHEIRHFEVDPGAPIGRFARRAVDGSAGRGLLPPHLGAASLRGTLRLLRELGESDVVVATTTGTAMALATWRTTHSLRTPLVGIVAGLVNDPWRRPRRTTTGVLLGRMHSTVYGEGEFRGLVGRAPRLADRVHLNTFGVDVDYWSPVDRGSAGDVIAIGNDGHRDWSTLVRAAAEIPARIRVFTGHRRPDSLPPNVTWEEADWHRQVLTDDEVRELYRTAAVVVVPVRDVLQPSGQSVSLQAMACARPVVLTRSRGLWAPSTLQDGMNISLVPPGDATALATAVRTLLEDPRRAAAIGAEARAGVIRDAPVSAFADRLLEICKRAVDVP
jgi:hypothetical protein